MNENKITSQTSPATKQDKTQDQMSELVKAHLDEIAGGLEGHSSWYSNNASFEK